MENLNIEKDYYNDLPGKLPPEMMLDPVEKIQSQQQQQQQHHQEPLRRLSIQVFCFFSWLELRIN